MIGALTFLVYTLGSVVVVALIITAIIAVSVGVSTTRGLAEQRRIAAERAERRAAMGRVGR